MINLLYCNFKSIFSLLCNFYLYYCWLSYVSPEIFFHYYSFEYIGEALTFPTYTTDIAIKSWHLIVWYFPSHVLHFATTLRLLKSVLFFHMTSFNYGAQWARDVYPNCRSHQSNIMPGSIFIANIALCVACG